MESLIFLFNEAIKKGVIPQKLKMTVVYRILMKESKMKVSNYRPISILPLISKISEKLVHEYLIDFLDVLDVIKHSIIAGNKRQELFIFSRFCKGIQCCEP